MVGKGLPGPKEAMAGTGGPWVGVTAEVSDPGRKGASLPTEADAETLAARWRVERRIELIEETERFVQRKSSNSLHRYEA